MKAIIFKIFGLSKERETISWTNAKSELKIKIPEHRFNFNVELNVNKWSFTRIENILFGVKLKGKSARLRKKHREREREREQGLSLPWRNCMLTLWNCYIKWPCDMPVWK
jgi:hypothetical protein